jgi:choline/ethanolamine phosphotransferase
MPSFHLVPRWIAPNLITLLGTILMFITYLAHIYFMPQFDGAGSAPSWVYFLGGFGLLGYQILDNVDGKQARATGTSSPLGQLFDHGCDGLTFGFIIIAETLTLRAEMHEVAVLLFCSQFVFFLAHWQERQIHVLNTLGVAEFQLVSYSSLYYIHVVVSFMYFSCLLCLSSLIFSSNFLGALFIFGL